jgi:tumor protein p53-inducible protein 3
MSGQIRIRVHCSGVNRADTLQRQGRYAPPAGESEILGLEVAGEVMEVSPQVDSFRPGERVMALLAGGGYAEEVCVDAGLALPVPASFGYPEAAAIPEAFLTAHHNLFYLGEAKPEQAALVHAGASGVGTAAIQLLRNSSVKVFVTAGSEEKAAFCETLGAIAILYKKENFGTRLAKETNGRGVNVILDPVGANYLGDNLNSLGEGGRLVLIGLMGGKDSKIDLSLVLRRRIRIIGSTLRPLPLLEKTSAVERFYTQGFSGFEQRKLKPIIDSIFPANEAGKAHERMEANLNTGKIVLQW